MSSNKPKDFDTSTAWHDYTVTEIIARHFWVGETTGYQAVANAWAQIAEGKIDELGLDVGFTEGVGFLHALNTFGKNIHINGYGHKTNGGRQSYVDYRLLEQYTSSNHNDFMDNGYAVRLNASPHQAIDDHKSKYANEMILVEDSGKSYLPSTKEYLVSDSIVSILCGDFMESLADSMNATYGLKSVSAIMSAPRTHWKTESPWCNEQVNSPSAILVMAAIEDHHPLSGVLQISAGSHKFDADPEILEDLTTMETYSEYVQFCHFLANLDVGKIYQHMPMTGDIIAWHEKSLYSNAIPGNYKAYTRNSLIGVFEKVNIDDNKDSLIPIPNRNRLFLIK
jgi:hypothetical protein